MQRSPLLIVALAVAVLLTACTSTASRPDGTTTSSAAPTPTEVRPLVPGLPRFTDCEKGTVAIDLGFGPPRTTVEVVVDGQVVLQQQTDSFDNPNGTLTGPGYGIGNVSIPCGRNLVVSLRVRGARGKPATCKLSEIGNATDPDVVASGNGSVECRAVATGSRVVLEGPAEDDTPSAGGQIAGCPAARVLDQQAFTPVRLAFQVGDSSSVQQITDFPNGVGLDQFVAPDVSESVSCAASKLSYTASSGSTGRCRILDGVGHVVIDAVEDDATCAVRLVP